MKSVTLVAALLFGAVFGFSLGRATAPADPPSSASSAAADTKDSELGESTGAPPLAGSRTAPSMNAAARVGARASDPAAASTVAASDAGTTAFRTPTQLLDAGVGAPCDQVLQVAENNLAVLEARRKELEGEPIAPREDVAPRFASAGLVRTFDDAFRATKIKGGVETVDCSEFPCIVFGRLSGDEAMVAELEDSKFFAQYDDDVGVMLTWASGDHEREGGPKEGLEREKPPEISLFAFSFYGHDDKRKHGDALDRRIRTRTAEYWNASRPDQDAE